MTDFHSHILPMMDDGSDSVKTSIKMLHKSFDSDVDIIVATPHYYAENEDVPTFLKRRDESYELLQKELKLMPDYSSCIVLGAEVYLFSGLGRLENVRQLCIGGSKYLLLEMPFTEWTSLHVREVATLCARGITPILAHIERYRDLQKGNHRLSELLNLGVLVQSNAEALLDCKTRAKVLHQYKNGTISLIGTDCHDATDRVPGLTEALKVLESRLGKKMIERLQENSSAILRPTAL